MERPFETHFFKTQVPRLWQSGLKVVPKAILQNGGTHVELLQICFCQKTRIDEESLFRFSVDQRESSSKFFAANEKFTEVIVWLGIFDDIDDAV